MHNPIPKYFDHPDKSIRFIEWAAFAKKSKNMVKPLLTFLTKKLGALVLLQRGKVGTSSGRVSKYKRLV